MRVAGITVRNRLDHIRSKAHTYGTTKCEVDLPRKKTCGGFQVSTITWKCFSNMPTLCCVLQALTTRNYTVDLDRKNHINTQPMNNCTNMYKVSLSVFVYCRHGWPGTYKFGWLADGMLDSPLCYCRFFHKVHQCGKFRMILDGLALCTTASKGMIGIQCVQHTCIACNCADSVAILCI